MSVVSFRVAPLKIRESPLSQDQQDPEEHYARLTVAAGARGAQSDVRTAISDGMVGLLEEFYGCGPTQAKSYLQDDLVVCVLRGGYSRVEQTLLDGGRGSAVMQQRMEFQEVMRDRFTAVVEQATGRPVIGFMSGNQQDPDMMCEVFILSPSYVLNASDPRSPEMGPDRP